MSFNYREKRLELIREMTPLRKFYKIKGHVWHDGKVMWHHEDGTIVPIIRTMAVEVKSKVKKLKVRWEVGEMIDYTDYNNLVYDYREIEGWLEKWDADETNVG